MAGDGGDLVAELDDLDPVPLAREIDRSALVGLRAAEALLGFDGSPTTVYTRSDEASVEGVPGPTDGAFRPPAWPVPWPRRW